MSDLALLRPIGLALVRATEIMSAEPYFHEFIAGVERAVRPAGYSVLLNVLPDAEAEAAVDLDKVGPVLAEEEETVFL